MSGTTGTGDGSGYNDRTVSAANEAALPKPQIEIIVDGNSVFKPGMKTYFVDTYDNAKDAKTGEYTGKVMGEYCTCDTVTSVTTVCICESVCTCQSHCSCVGYSRSICSANIAGGLGGSTTICTCQAVSCGSPCACVPVT